MLAYILIFFLLFFSKSRKSNNKYFLILLIFTIMRFDIGWDYRWYYSLGARYEFNELSIFIRLDEILNYMNNNISKAYDIWNFYKVEIKDTGKGIKKEDLKHIWDKYYHSDKKHKRNNYGTGLGLSIVKNILQMHNYKYGVESSDKGATFYFEIPKDN